MAEGDFSERPDFENDFRDRSASLWARNNLAVKNAIESEKISSYTQPEAKFRNGELMPQGKA